MLIPISFFAGGGIEMGARTALLHLAILRGWRGTGGHASGLAAERPSAAARWWCSPAAGRAAWL
ncbi:hypothetical protein ACFQAT_24340 [Undibacterium arcticum]|uniref:Uncharacterized protein n=1 Tax=Undibacterium arcticum TaxID=1762892 RepID=A0ABV7FAW1_9BURK